MLVKQTLPFQTTVTASTSKTITSKAIVKPFYTWKFIMHFPDTANYDLLYRWFWSRDDKIEGTRVPSGLAVFLDESINDSWRGKNMTLEVAHIKKIEETPAFIKLYITNGVATELDVCCYCEILREI